jgi:hypothetical protein
MAAFVGPVITAVEQLIQYLLALKAAGQLADADLDTLVANTNVETRALIAQALGRPLPPTP